MIDWKTDNIINIDTDGGYTIDQVLSNKNCSKDPKYWWRIDRTDRYLFKSDVAESWEFFDSRIENPVGNTNVIYLRFLDSSVFCEPANTYRRFDYYDNSPPDSISSNQYWDQQEDICWEGLEVDGVRITGRQYFFINFCPIKAIPVDHTGKPLSKRKVETLPRFLDHQYYWSFEVEEGMLEGPYRYQESFHEYFPLSDEQDWRNLILEGQSLTKARRKGFSYFKAGAIHAYNLTFLESSSQIIAAYEKDQYKTPLDGVHFALNSLNKYTVWGKRRDVLNKRDHFKMSYWSFDEFGIKVEEGYKSELRAISFKDNPMKAIGDSADVLDFEEAGRWHGFLEGYSFTEPLFRDGADLIGWPIVGGSAGDVESGASADLQTVVYDPTSYSLKDYKNIYEKEEIAGTVGYFIDDLWYHPGTLHKNDIITEDEYLLSLLDKYQGEVIDFVDIQGNSHRRFAEYALDAKRKVRKKGDRRAYQKFITQQPKYLSECFLISENSPFDVGLAKEVLSKLKATKYKPEEYGTFIVSDTGNPEWRNDFSLEPILEFPLKQDNTTGCWIIYNKPDRAHGEIPNWRYIAGCDPIDFGYDETSSGGKHSLASTFIIDTLTRNIVAEYTGRPRVAEEYFEQLWRGLEYYNAELLYENNLKGLFSYFKTKNKVYLLAEEPESLKDRSVRGKPTDKKGFHATASTNSWARELINTWTLEEVFVNEETKIPRMYFLKSVPLLQELIRWNSMGNFDRVSSLGACVLLLNERHVFIEEARNETKKLRAKDKFFTRINKFKK